MAAGQSGQWPGDPPPAAERKAAEVEDDFARDGTDAPPDRAARTRVDDSPVAADGPRSGTERDVTERDVTERDATERDATERDATERDAIGPAAAAPGATAPEAAVAGAPGPVTPAPGAADGSATLLEPDHTEEFRRRWDAIKASFVDDPREAVRRAEQLAEEVVAEITRTVDARRRELIERREGIGDEEDKTGTERLRVVLHGYRGVLDPVLRR